MWPERGDWTIERVPVALLAGGLATRLRPLTERIPKSLIEVAGRPFIDHQLALLQRHGIRQVVLCLGHLGEEVQRHLGDSWPGLELSYSYDGDRLLGTAGALLQAAPLLGNVFWVIYGDSYLDIPYRDILHRFRGESAPALMTLIANHNRWDRSNVRFRDGRLLAYNKRQPSADMTHVDYGAALLCRSVLEAVPAGWSYDLADLYQALVSHGQMIGHEISERFYEIGSPAGLAETDAHLRFASPGAAGSGSTAARRW